MASRTRGSGPTPTELFVIGVVIVGATTLHLQELSADVDPVKVRFFEERIRPALVKHCYRCHSSAAKSIKGQLRLDSGLALRKGGESGAIVAAGKPDDSLIIQALEYGELKMPPGKKFPAGTIADFRRWITDGAVDTRQAASDAPRPKKPFENPNAGEFWSLRPLAQAATPKIDSDWPRNAIDQFVLHRQLQKGIAPSGRAEPLTLLRRLYFDLIGLPPPAGRVTEFTDRLSDAQYGQLVEELLDRPQFGERWGRYWLDVARFAESSGFEQDYDRPEAFHYRDFVIRAFNDDMPFDQFVRWQIAGDQIEPANPTAVVATGFVVAGVENLIQSRKEYVRDRYDKLADMSNTVGTALLGLSVGCARCHDHKYDPISQREYYRLTAAFATTVSAVRDVGEAPQSKKAFVASEAPDGRIRMTVVTEPSFNSLPSIPARVHFLVRGDPQHAEEEAELAFPAVLNKQGRAADRWGETDTTPRAVLANWLTDANDGAGHLLARVMVNRIWQHYFGRGIVATPNDFGLRGEPPTHPQLLEYLAGELIRRKWRMKPIHRMILNSATYQQRFTASGDDAQVVRNLELDAENQLLWRREPRRLDAEAIRDNLLSVSGRLDATMFGRGTLDENSPRRSIYLTVKRSRLSPTLQLFDAPSSLQGVGRRPATTTAPQGLLILNSPFVDRCAVAFAKRLEPAAEQTDNFIRKGFITAVARPPAENEIAISRELLQPDAANGARDFCHMLFCLNEFIYVD